MKSPESFNQNPENDPELPSENLDEEPVPPALKDRLAEIARTAEESKEVLEPEFDEGRIDRERLRDAIGLALSEKDPDPTLEEGEASEES